ncbi:hypothetical protein [Micromonospora sp. URMC 103]|uniref:hypothetical protein n=1 Tax=Micromonospora sp. URMC 103 TaxID=3423406 RepID=UPI003F1CF643
MVVMLPSWKVYAFPRGSGAASGRPGDGELADDVAVVGVDVGLVAEVVSLPHPQTVAIRAKAMRRLVWITPRRLARSR